MRLPAALAPFVQCLWMETIGDVDGVYEQPVLPDGCVDIVAMGGRVVVAGREAQLRIAVSDPEPEAVSIPAASSRAGTAVQAALSVLGTPYVGYKASPSEGFAELPANRVIGLSIQQTPVTRRRLRHIRCRARFAQRMDDRLICGVPTDPITPPGHGGLRSA